MSRTFDTYLRAEVKRIAKREQLSASNAFLFWFATTILELSDDDAREAISVEGANDKGIDLFWVDDNEGRIIIAQGQFSRGLRSCPPVSKVTRMESSVNWLANPEALRQDGRPDLAQAAEDYLSATKDGYGVELWFVYSGPKCANIDKHIVVYNQNPDNLSKRRAIRHYDISMLRATWEELEGASRRIPSGTVSTVGGRVLPFEGVFGRALVASVPGAEIVRLYQENGERLFDRNVRLFLGVRKGSVNAGIAETLKDETESQNFWAYNNGITVVCDKFTVTQSGSAIKVRNFSIVNGCQTAVSLAQGPAEHVGRTAVLMRFVAASPDILDEVIRFTNSQNPIRTWDIASQDKTQRRLKTEFEELDKPFIYLTRRGARPKGNLKRFRADGKLRQIRVDIMGQYAAAFRGNPVLAYKHKAFIFSRYHDDVFPPDVRVEEVLFQWTSGELAKVAVQEAIGKKKEEEIRVLKKGGTLFVTAVMARILSLRNGATYLRGASESSITSKSAAKRLKKYAEYARDKYVQAVLDQAAIQESEELSTLIRSLEFYDKVIGRIERSFETDSRAERWASEALPKLNFKTQGRE